MNKQQGLQLNQESTQMRLCRFRDRHGFSLQTVKANISHQLQAAALTAAQGEGEACYSHLSKKLAGFFTCQESSGLSISAALSPFLQAEPRRRQFPSDPGSDM